MNVQSRIRDLDATAARPKARKGWIAGTVNPATKASAALANSAPRTDDTGYRDRAGVADFDPTDFVKAFSQPFRDGCRYQPSDSELPIQDKSCTGVKSTAASDPTGSSAAHHRTGVADRSFAGK